jgi:P-type Cu2+ transporter
MSTLREVKALALQRCQHCGSEFHQRNEKDSFCCSGCEYVYGLIHDESLEKYYDLQGPTASPIGFRVFSAQDYSWLKDLAEKAEIANARQPSLTLSLEGISCIGCVWLIEKLFSKQPGARDSRIDVQHGEIELSWIAGKFDIISYAQKLHDFGYDLSPKKLHGRSENKKITWRIALCGAFSLNGMLYTLPSYLGMESSFFFSRYFLWLSAIFASLSMLVGGSYFIRKAASAAAQKIVHMDLPIAIGLVVAYSASCYAFFSAGNDSLLYFDFISTFVFLMLCGKWLQIYAIERNRNRLASIEVRPPQVSRMGPLGVMELVDSSEINPGDHYRLDPGLWVPVESELISHRACLGMDWINGESESRLFSQGSSIPSGSINQTASGIELIAKERWQESLLYKLLASRGERSQNDRIAQKWISIYLLTVILLATIGAGYWIALGLVSKALIVFVSALVVSCPCALGVALPLANELAASQLKLRGVFVRSHNLWNRLAKITQVVFDKTGTLTRSTLDWINPDLLNELDEEALEALSALTLHSRHPVSTTVHEALLAKGYFKNPEGWQTSEELGKGMEATKGDSTWRFGKASWSKNEPDGPTLLSRDGITIAQFNFEDRPWADAAFEFTALKKAGKKVAILSGDTEDKVQKAASALGLPADKAISGASPEMKAEWLSNNQGQSTLILGDGANDSLAFEEALCCGTPAAEKTTLTGKADFYYLGAGIQGVRYLFTIASKRAAAIRLLLIFALGYNLITISLALAGFVTPLLAAVLMPLSSIASLLIVWGFLRSGP